MEGGGGGGVLSRALARWAAAHLVHEPGATVSRGAAKTALGRAMRSGFFDDAELRAVRAVRGDALSLALDAAMRGEGGVPAYRGLSLLSG